MVNDYEDYKSRQKTMLPLKYMETMLGSEICYVGINISTPVPNGKVIVTHVAAPLNKA